MIIDQTSSPRTRRGRYQFNGDQCYYDGWLTGWLVGWLTGWALLWPMLSRIANIMWKLKISKHLELCDTMVWHVMRRFLFLCNLCRRFCHYLRSFGWPFAVVGIFSWRIFRVYRRVCMYFFSLFSFSSHFTFCSQFSIRLILIANRVINTVISFIVSLCLYGLTKPWLIMRKSQRVRQTRRFALVWLNSVEYVTFWFSLSILIAWTWRRVSSSLDRSSQENRFVSFFFEVFFCFVLSSFFRFFRLFSRKRPCKCATRGLILAMGWLIALALSSIFIDICHGNLN